MNPIFFNIRNREDFNKYYPIFKEWWEGKKGFKPIDPQLLSSNGIIIEDKTDLLCAGWIYRTDSLYGVINWIITNNSQDGFRKRKALNFLLKKLEERAKQLGIALIYIPMETKSIKNLLNKEGWINTSNGISEFFKQIE